MAPCIGRVYLVRPLLPRIFRSSLSACCYFYCLAMFVGCRLSVLSCVYLIHLVGASKPESESGTDIKTEADIHTNIQTETEYETEYDNEI